MKKFIISIAASVIFILMITSCSSTQSSHGDYFGYNKPPADKFYSNNSSAQDQNGDISGQNNVRTAENAEKEWKNPLADDYSGGVASSRSAYNPDIQVYYNDISPMYVPVIVPWWDRYYGWVSYPRRGINIFIGSGYYGAYYGTYWGGYYGGYYAYDWYNPWYTYHPYYGYSWSRYVYPTYYSWWNQPIYSRHYGRSVRTNEVRTWGPSRGNINDRTGTSLVSSGSGNRTSSRTDFRGSSSRDGSIQAISPDRSNSTSNTSPSRTSIRTNSTSTENPIKGVSTISSENYTTPQSIRSRPELNTIYDNNATKQERSSSRSTKNIQNTPENSSTPAGSSYESQRSYAPSSSSSGSSVQPSSSGSSKSSGSSVSPSSSGSSRSSGSSSGSSSPSRSSGSSGSSSSSSSRSSSRTR